MWKDGPWMKMLSSMKDESAMAIAMKVGSQEKKSHAMGTECGDLHDQED
jgi:hypothetical protein